MYVFVQNICKLYSNCALQTSVADPERFDADPDPTFQADADPDPNPFTRVKIFFLPKSSKSCHM